MKKVYIAILAIGSVSLGHSQKATESALLANKKFATEVIESSKAPGNLEKAGGDVIWSDNFSTASNWVIDNSGQTAAGYGWDIGATEQSWYFTSVINSTSDGNFAELNNGNPTSNPATQALDVTYTITTAAPIDVNTLSGGPNNYILEFQQYGAKFNDAQEMYISTNGTTWTLVGDNSDIATLSQTGGSAYTNPTVKTINLSGALPGGTNSLWIRFSWTTAFPSSATNPNVWVTYGWMIDDVRILEAYSDEFKMSAVFSGDIVNNFDYYSTPMDQVISRTVGIAISNEGGVSQSKAIGLNIDLAGSSVYAGVAPAVTLAPGASDTVWFDTQFLASATGLYTITATLPADQVLTNNSLTENFEMTNFLYGHNHPLGTGKLNFSDEAEIGIGNIYEIQAEQLLKGIDVAFATGTTAGIFIDVFVFEMPSGSVQGADNVLVADFQYQMPATVNTTSFTTLVLPTPYTMEAGKIYYAILRTQQSATEKMAIKSSDKGDADFSTVCYGPFGAGDAVNNFVGWDAAAAVSLNFDPSVQIAENESPVSFGSIFPNPTSGATTLQYTLSNDTDVKVVIVDVTGKVVYAANSKNQTAGAHELNFNAAAFTNGVYYVNMITEGSTVTTKFIKK